MKIVTRLLLLAILLFPSVPAARADSLLYASDGTNLYTVDLQTGALTFVSDGPLRWIASPAFDEEHHTRLWISGFPREHVPYGILSDVLDGVQFSWGNPSTGESGGPYPATASFYREAYSSASLFFFPDLAVYASTTQRLYTIGIEELGGQSYVPVLIDQYNGPALPGFGQYNGGFWDAERTTTLAFDPTTGQILQAYAGSSDDGARGHGVRALHPLTGTWGDVFSSDFPCDACEPPTSITAMAVEPQTGDFYFVRVQWGVTTFVRRDRTTGQESEITDLAPNTAWSLRFADSRWAGN